MKIILFRGRPGAGKTTVSHAFAEITHFPVLRKDDFYDPASVFLKDHGERNRLSHDTLYKILESNAHTNATFILDFAFQNEKDFSMIKDWCAEHNIELKSILVTCSDETTWAERFNKRAESPAPNQLITNFDELKKYYGFMQIEKEPEELLVDTKNSIKIILNEVLEYLSPRR